MIVALIIGGVALLGMIGVSWYGWLTLPADARVPIHFGVATYNNFVPKRVGLALHPAAGALVYVLLAVAGYAAAHPGRPSSPVEVILPIIMCLLLFVQVGAIRIARQRASV